MTVPQEATQTLTLADVAPALPPPPVMSPEDFRTVSSGMTRADVLKFGAPASRITMFEDGHLVEVYSYRQNGQSSARSVSPTARYPASSNITVLVGGSESLSTPSCA